MSVSKIWQDFDDALHVPSIGLILIIPLQFGTDFALGHISSITVGQGVSDNACVRTETYIHAYIHANIWHQHIVEVRPPISISEILNLTVGLRSYYCRILYHQPSDGKISQENSQYWQTMPGENHHSGLFNFYFSCPCRHLCRGCGGQVVVLIKSTTSLSVLFFFCYTVGIDTSWSWSICFLQSDLFNFFQ